jgi:hypothetical protein
LTSSSKDGKGKKDLNLLIARSNILEIHKLDKNGFQSVVDLELFGHISVLKTIEIRTEEMEKDLLFIVT